MTPPPPPPPGTGNDNVTLFGVLGIVLGICLWPVGLVFAILSMRAAGRVGKPKTLGIIGIVIAVLAGIYAITNYHSITTRM